MQEKMKYEEFNAPMRIDSNGNWVISANRIIFLWEPGRDDKIYRAALVLNEEVKVNGKRDLKTKYLFVGSGKLYNYTDFNEACYFTRDDMYNHFDLVFGYDDYLDYDLKEYPKLGNFLDCLSKAVKGKDLGDFAELPPESYNPDYDFRQIPFNIIKEIDTELVQLQEKFFEKDQKTEKEPKKPTSLTEKLKKQYLEPEQER